MEFTPNQEQQQTHPYSSSSGDIREFGETASFDNGDTLDDEEQEDISFEYSNTLTPQKRRKSKEPKKASRSFYNFPPHHNFTIQHPHVSINDTLRGNNYDHSDDTELDIEDIEDQVPATPTNTPSNSFTNLFQSAIPFTDKLSSFFDYLKKSRQGSCSADIMRDIFIFISCILDMY